MHLKCDDDFKIQHKRKHGIVDEQKIQFNLECKENIYVDAETFYEQYRNLVEKTLITSWSALTSLL